MAEFWKSKYMVHP